MNQHNIVVWTFSGPLRNSMKAAFQRNFLLEMKLQSHSTLKSLTSSLKFIELKADTAFYLKFKQLLLKPTRVSFA